ncbi:MAG: tRNA 2-selenouridine(34) synthase MnmH [Pseudomonadota bacterium]
MRPQITVADRHGFSTIIDARSPAEFAIDHIPGAINCPVLDDEERRIVGTLYKQQGAFEARRVGGAMVAANLALHIREKFADKPASWKPMVYCWRGGMRSGSMTTWLRLVGWDAQQLPGGYKGWRRHVIALIDRLSAGLPFVVICGATGNAKTRILQALAARGEQVLDLEGLACHKGSLLGAMQGQPQPSQTAFETQLASVLETVDLQRPLYVEGESRRIGQINVPVQLVDRLRSSPCIEIDATTEARVEYLLRDYAYLGERPDWLAGQLGMLKDLHGKETIASWQQWALAGDLPPLFRELAVRHYDPAYNRSQRAHFRHWEQRKVISTDDLSPAAVDRLAGEVVGLGLAPAPAASLA